jgi:hypothetical protein
MSLLSASFSASFSSPSSIKTLPSHSPIPFSHTRLQEKEDVKKVLKESVEKESTFAQFTEFVEQSGVIVEEMMDPPAPGLSQTTPSVQLYIHDDNEV